MRFAPRRGGKVGVALRVKFLHNRRGGVYSHTRARRRKFDRASGMETGTSDDPLPRVPRAVKDQLQDVRLK